MLAICCYFRNRFYHSMKEIFLYKNKHKVLVWLCEAHIVIAFLKKFKPELRMSFITQNTYSYSPLKRIFLNAIQYYKSTNNIVM